MMDLMLMSGGVLVGFMLAWGACMIARVFARDWTPWQDIAENKGGTLLQEREDKATGYKQRRLVSPW